MTLVCVKQTPIRRIDPDVHYPTFGDDGTVEQMAPTSGKFFVELTQNQNRALWGNFKVGYLDNELAQVDRGLYGANLHYETVGTTAFGDERLAFDAFAAEPDPSVFAAIRTLRSGTGIARLCRSLTQRIPWSSARAHPFEISTG